MEDCIFCKIVKGEIPCDKVYDGDDFMAFADINPAGEGHTLVVPKEHFSSLKDLDTKTSKKYIDALKEVSELLIKKHNADGFNLVLNNGKAAGQLVEHVHFHILPRKQGDKKKGLYLT